MMIMAASIARPIQQHLMRSGLTRYRSVSRVTHDSLHGLRWRNRRIVALGVAADGAGDTRGR